MTSSSRPTSSSRARGGFTLIELVLAMTFVALLAGGIVISISTALKVWRRVAEANELHQEARAVMELISRDLRGAYFGLYHNAGFFLGMPAETSDAPIDSLYLTTQTSSAAEVGLLPDEFLEGWDQTIEAPVTDLAGVFWGWQKGGAGPARAPEGLYRTTFVMPVLAGEEAEEESLAVTGEVSSEFVSDAVEELRFEYFDGESWAPEWDSREQENRAPQAVAIEFVLHDPRDRENVRRTQVSNDEQRTFRSVVTLPTW